MATDPFGDMKNMLAQLKMPGIDMAAKSGRPAGFYRSHDASFATAKMTGVLSSVRHPMSPKDVRNLEGGTHSITVPAVSLQVVTDQVGWLSIGSYRWKPGYSVPCSTDGAWPQQDLDDPDDSATIRMRRRIASPELFPDCGLLPHLICCPPTRRGGINGEAGEHGDTRRVGGSDCRAVYGRWPRGAWPNPR